MISDGTKIFTLHSLDRLAIYLKSRGAGGRAPEIYDHLIGFESVQVQMVILAHYVWILSSAVIE